MHVRALCITCPLGVTAGAKRARNRILPTGNFNGPMDTQYHSYHKMLCEWFPLMIITTGMFIIIFMWGLFVSMTMCVCMCVCACMCGSNSGLSGCVSSAKIMISFVCHQFMISCVYAFSPSPHHPTHLLDVSSCHVFVLFQCVLTPAFLFQKLKHCQTETVQNISSVKHLCGYLHNLNQLSRLVTS